MLFRSFNPWVFHLSKDSIQRLHTFHPNFSWFLDLILSPPQHLDAIALMVDDRCISREERCSICAFCSMYGGSPGTYLFPLSLLLHQKPYPLIDDITDILACISDPMPYPSIYV
jgi:hypothetical protein